MIFDECTERFRVLQTKAIQLLACWIYERNLVLLYVTISMALTHNLKTYVSGQGSFGCW